MTTLKLNTSYAGCPGSYDLHLYCKWQNPAHDWDEFPWEVVEHETRPKAERAARKSGWVFHRDGSATCPKCARLLGLKPEAQS